MNSSASSYYACEKITKDTPSSVGPTPSVGLVSQCPLFGQDVIVHHFPAHCLHAAVPFHSYTCKPWKLGREP